MDQKSLPQVSIPPYILEIKPYVPGKPIEEVKRELGLKKIIKLASNENPLGPSSKAIQAIKEYAAQVNLYPDGGGWRLRKVLSEKLELERENIILGNGSDEIVSLITRVFLREGEEVIVGDPSFLMYSIDAQLSGGRVISVSLKDFKLDLKRMKEVHILVIFDEAYYEYVDDPGYPQTLDFIKEGRNVIVLRTFSKIYGLAGLRVGYGIAKKEIVAVLNRVRSPFNVNSLAQVAALASLEDEDQVKRSRKLIEKEKEFLYFHLRELGLSFIPTQANFILIKIGKRAGKVEQALLKRGIIVRGMEGYNLSEYIRVTIGTRKQNEEFLESLQKILSSAK